MDLKGKVINVLGDSITEGVGVTDKAHTYEAVLGDMVGAKEVRNCGVSATRIAKQVKESCGLAADSHFSCRYKTMPDDADLVLVFGGTNDYGHGGAPFGTPDDRTENTFCGACHVLFRGLVEKYPAAKIVVLTPLQRTGCTVPNGNAGKPLLAYVDVIREVAAYYALPVLDLYRTAGICPDMPVQKEKYCPDGLHPCNAGAARIAAQLAAFLKTL